MPDLYPKYAVVLPHPTEPRTCAVDVVSGVLPLFYLGTDAVTDEKAALLFARRISGDRQQSVQAVTRTTILGEAALREAVCELKPARTDRLSADFRWQCYDFPYLVRQQNSFKPILNFPRAYARGTAVGSETNEDRALLEANLSGMTVASLLYALHESSPNREEKTTLL